MNSYFTWEQRHRKIVKLMKAIQYVIVVLIVPLLLGNLKAFIVCFGVAVIGYYSIEIYQNFLEAGIGNKKLLTIYSILSVSLVVSVVSFSFFNVYCMPVTIGALTVGFLSFKTYRITALGLGDRNINLIVSLLLVILCSLLGVASFYVNQMLFYGIVHAICAFYWVYYWTVRLIMEKRDIRKDDIE